MQRHAGERDGDAPPLLRHRAALVLVRRGIARLIGIVAPGPHDRGLARGAEQRAVLRPTGARDRDRSRARPRAPGCRRGSSRSGRGWRPAACCRGCCRRPGDRAPARSRTARSRRRSRARPPTSRARPGSRTHSALRPSPGVPSSSSKLRASAIRISTRSMIVPSWRSRISRGGQSSGGGTSGRTAHSPRYGMSRSPSAALTVRISSPSTDRDAPGPGRSGGRARPR